MADPTFVLVHGAYHGGWCWQKVQTELRARGLESIAVDLPGHGDSTAPLADLYGDAAAVREVIDSIDGEVVLVGHSYGGAVITEAAAGHDLAHLVYLAAGAPEAGRGTVFEEPPGAPLSLSADDARERFYNDCSAADIAAALVRIDAQHPQSMRQPVSETSWRRIPSTYVVCTEDRALPVDLQRKLAAKVGRMVELEAGHSPFLSVPDRVADVLEAVARPPA